MEMSESEKLMYEAMKAIFDSGIPISFKGSMVLKAVLIENGYSGEARHTVDIDGNWISSAPPSMETMLSSIQAALDKARLSLSVFPYREYGPGRSAGFDFKEKESGKSVFTMDIDVNRPAGETRIYEVEGLAFSGLVLSNMLADKIGVISSDKVFRRIKDVIDVYYLSKIVALDEEAVLKAASASGRIFGNFEGFLTRKEDLCHSYRKFNLAGGVPKPPFEEIYEAVRTYLSCFLPSKD